MIPLETVDATIETLIRDDTNGYLYEVKENGNLEIINYFGVDNVVIIPEVYENHYVTSIGRFAFYENETIIELVIPVGIEKIGYCAFSGAKQLKRVDIYGDKYWAEEDEEVPYYGNRAFDSCVKLESVNLHNGISSLGNKSFHWCENLNEFFIPVTVGKIENESIGFNKFVSGSEPSVIADTKFKIFGYENSIAQEYAEKNRMIFISVGNLIEEYMLDLNYDNAITAEDALLLLKDVAKICELDFNQKKIADANGNGILESSDALLILKFIVGL